MNGWIAFRVGLNWEGKERCCGKVICKGDRNLLEGGEKDFEKSGKKCE